MSITGVRIIADHYQATALRYLARLAATGGGYELRGVAGWAHLRDVELNTRSRLDGDLPRLHSMGLLDRVAVGLGQFRRATWVYRITEAGARASANTWGDPFERVPAPGALEKDHPVYIAPGPLNALEVLRLAYEAEGPERFGQRGWMTGRELSAFIDQLNCNRRVADHFARIDTMELKWLASVGFAERRDEKLAEGREKPVIYWRISEAGRVVRLLEWRKPRQ